MFYSSSRHEVFDKVRLLVISDDNWDPYGYEYFLPFAPRLTRIVWKKDPRNHQLPGRFDQWKMLADFAKRSANLVEVDLVLAEVVDRERNQTAYVIHKSLHKMIPVKSSDIPYIGASSSSKGMKRVVLENLKLNALRAGLRRKSLLLIWTRKNCESALSRLQREIVGMIAKLLYKSLK